MIMKGMTMTKDKRMERARLCYHRDHLAKRSSKTQCDFYANGWMQGYKEALKDVLHVILHTPTNEDKIDNLIEFMEDNENGD